MKMERLSIKSLCLLIGGAALTVCALFWLFLLVLLFARISHRLSRLYGIMQENQRKVDQERQELQMLVSDISHQVKTPVSNLKMVTAYTGKEKQTLRAKKISPVMLAKKHLSNDMSLSGFPRGQFIINISDEELRNNSLEMIQTENPFTDDLQAALSNLSGIEYITAYHYLPVSVAFEAEESDAAIVSLASYNTAYQYAIRVSDDCEKQAGEEIEQILKRIPELSLTSLSASVAVGLFLSLLIGGVAGNILCSILKNGLMLYLNYQSLIEQLHK